MRVFSVSLIVPLGQREECLSGGTGLTGLGRVPMRNQPELPASKPNRRSGNDSKLLYEKCHAQADHARARLFPELSLSSRQLENFSTLSNRL